MDGAQTFRPGEDPRALRAALGCFATGVTVVTCRDADGVPHGLTVNSFTSVSLDPPLLLVCPAKITTSAEPLVAADHFAVNVLSTDQRPASIDFSTPRQDRFDRNHWEEGTGGVPVLPGSLAVFECARHAVHDGGDHHILLGRVEQARHIATRDPLLYYRGAYRRIELED